MNRWTNTYRIGLLDRNDRRVAEQVATRSEALGFLGIGPSRGFTFSDLPGTVTITHVALVMPDGEFVRVPLVGNLTAVEAVPTTLVFSGEGDHW